MLDLKLLLLGTLFAPLVGVGAIWVVAPLGDRAVRWMALLVALVSLVCATMVVFFERSGDSSGVGCHRCFVACEFIGNSVGCSFSCRTGWSLAVDVWIVTTTDIDGNSGQLGGHSRSCRVVLWDVTVVGVWLCGGVCCS